MPLLALISCGHGRNAVFEILPQTPAYALRSPGKLETPFGDILRRFNGYEAGRGWIDLRPLMQLRIENAYYQQGSSRRGLEGFLGTEVAHYRVTSSGLNLLSVEPMKERPLTDLPVQNFISSQQIRRRFYRLYFEIVFARKKDATRGSVLLSADSASELDELAAKMTHPDALCDDSTAHCTVFPEACSVTAEIEISVNGKAVTQSWGATLARITGPHPKHLQVKRIYQGSLAAVKMNALDADALRLPLLPGDHIVWN